MVQLSERSRNLLLAGIVILVLVIAYFIIYQPRHQQITASQTHIDQQTQTLSQLQSVANQKPTYLALTKQIRSRLRGVELTADPRAYIPSYLKQIEALAKRDGLVVTSIVPQPLPSPSVSPSPGAPANPAAIQNAPVIGAPIRSAARVAGAEDINAVKTTQTGATAFATTAPALAGASPVPGQAAPGAVAALGAVATPTSARAMAMLYVTQSFSQVPVNMELQGSYANFRRFLRDLNKFPKLIGVGDATMAQTGTAGPGETPTLRITLPIIAYRLSPTPATAPAPAPGSAP